MSPSGLYPSLEDFKYDILMNSKHPNANIGTHLRGVINGQGSGSSGSSSNGKSLYANELYPSFNNYSGGLHNHNHNNNHSGSQANHDSFALDHHYHHNDAHSIGLYSSISLPGKSSLNIIAPLSGYSQAHKLQPSNAIKSVVICKDSSGKVGLRLSSIQGGVFVVLVYAQSPAAMAGLRFGDQILEINDIPVAGYSMKKVHDLIKKASPDELRFSIRDRPFERTVTLHKDQNGLVGFIFNKHGKILSIVKDSSAARNGLLIDHNIIEINAQNIVGLDEIDIRGILDNCGDVVVLTIVPSKIFEHLTKQTNPKLLRKNMDHSLPEI